MTNNKPTHPRAKFSELLNTNPRFKRAIERNRPSVQRFIDNNAYLLSLAGKSVYRQLIEIRELMGFEISQSIYCQIKTGKRSSANQAIYCVIADYWDMDAIDMETRDLRKEDEDRAKVA